MELRDKSDLLHLTDGKDFISCRDDDDKEISHASPHGIAMADRAYDADYHNYGNCDAPSQLHGLGRGLCNICPPSTKDDGEGKKRETMTTPAASIMGRAPSVLMSTSPACAYAYCHASTLSTPTATSPGSPRGDQCVPFARQ